MILRLNCHFHFRLLTFFSRLAHTALDEHQQAVACYKMALQYDPDNQSYQNNLNIAEEKQKQSQPVSKDKLFSMMNHSKESFYFMLKQVNLFVSKAVSMIKYCLFCTRIRKQRHIMLQMFRNYQECENICRSHTRSCKVGSSNVILIQTHPFFYF